MRFAHADPIVTSRLECRPGSVELAEAELAADGSFATRLDCRVPRSWPPGEYDLHAIAFLRDRMREGGTVCAGWYTWYAVERATRTLVAAGGYFGPPVDGVVEIGYSVVPEAQRRGLASELAEALVQRAFAQPLVRVVRAHTHEHNPASIRVLERCGFRRSGGVSSEGAVEFVRERSA
ncbi:MAG: GNAT family N-acetyltransferase [Candidatus Eisenbacteria bacterium]